MSRNAVWSLTLVLLVGAWAPLSAQQAGTAQDDVVARVGDREVTLGELEQRWRETDPGSFMQVAQSRFDALDQYLDLLVGDRILEVEAANRGISVDALLQAELPGRLSPVTDADVEQFYNSLGSGQTQGRTLEQLRVPIQNFLQQQRPAQARAELVAELSASLNLPVENLLDPPRQNVSVAPTDPIKGTSEASVEIIEFSD
ncbi:MAG: hypothetical protein QF664_05970, partial [Dehalococcoidia bacterium]|nr:hypothetical protein [Dehalococcoidia bacterium]